MNHVLHKSAAKKLRKNRVRSKVVGTAERPRLSVTISNLNVSAQLIDDQAGRTVLSATSVGSKTKETLTQKAALVGTKIGASAKKAKITHVVFDRNGRRYAGRLAALADAVRKEGIEV